MSYIYMNECRFTDPSLEDAWNEWYSGTRLDQLFAVPGFLTQQRFKAVSVGVPPYLGLYTIDSMEFFTRKEYKAIGGGAFIQEWQPYVADLSRNLFTGLDFAPAIPLDNYLIVIEGGKGNHTISGIDFSWLRIAGLDRSALERGIARADAQLAQQLLVEQPSGVAIYAPMFAQKNCLGESGSGGNV